MGIIGKRLRRGAVAIVGLIAVGPCLQSCFTGVEGTGKVTLSKKEITAVAPTAEELYLSDIIPSPLKDWPAGKAFRIADEKFRLIVEGATSNSLMPGDTIFYRNAESRHSAGGGERTLLIFDSAVGEIGYPMEKSLQTAMDGVSTADLPMLIDLRLVEAVREKLTGKTFWTKTALWYDDSLKYLKGKKFDEVRITDVGPGSSFFPFLISFSDTGGRRGNLLMNLGSSGNDSRGFGKLFSLSDPYRNYKHISKENWEAIQKEQLRLGMTKEESRLSRGNPSDVNTGHDYSTAMEIWFYPDGTYLQFADGLLVNYK